MRISMRTMYEGLLTDLEHLTDDIHKYQVQIASGKLYDRPSQAPVKLNYALGYRKALQEVDRYQTSIREAKAFLRTTEGALSGLEDVVMRAKELALQAANDTQSPESRKAIAKEVDNLLEEALSLANTTHAGRYVFAGNHPTGYSAGKKPFELVKKALPGGEVVERVVYHGGREDFYQGYAKGSKILVGRNGEEAIMASGIFETLIGLKKTLLNNNEVDPHQEVEDIQRHIARLDKVLQHLVQERTDLGARMDHLEVKENLYQDLQNTLKENLSDVEDTDLLEAVSKLSAKQTAYEAALKAAARTMQLSLVNFL
ncbi:MAG TPA: flagellar hook-associated protein 3 [Thermosulfurimonas dismutans]|uniref:Flagellar hook-associated protein 3 n=1 Tax=Thermosulfurimonas dismutans TaxID=999894 RepID=A0A7C3CZJ6_9BACT|nr:flagellar hook-associated protein 3 [Thermosulfurimonas dismutans]